MRLSGTKATAIHQYRGLGNQLWDLAGNRPSLDLPFAESKSLVDATTGTNLIDFTRASSGTYVGSDGLIKTATTNLLLYSEEFDTTWTAVFATISSNSTTAPNGEGSADKLTVSATNGALYQVVSITGGVTLTWSIYAKKDTVDWFAFGTYDGVTEVRQFFDLVNGAIGSSQGTILSAEISDAGNGWYRCSCSRTIDASATSVRHQINTASSDLTRDTGSIYIWGAQLEQSSTVGEYVKTTSTINSAPRFDHDPTTGECLGLLVEEQRTNLLTYSEGIGGTAWLTSRSAITLNSATAPDNTNTATLWIDDTAGATYIYKSGFTFTAGITYTLSVYAKQYSGQQLKLTLSSVNGFSSPVSTDFNLDTGTVASGAGTITSAGNGWYRCSITGVCTSTTTNNWVAFWLNNDTASTGLYIWGAQLEEGSFPTSYIPTEGSAVTRAADVASISGSNFSSWYRQDEGTVFSDNLLNPGNTGSYAAGIISIDDDTSQNQINQYYSSATQVSGYMRTAGATVANVAAGSFVSGSDVRAASAFGFNNVNSATNGLIGTTDTSATLPTVTILRIGRQFYPIYLNGTISRLTYWPTRLPNETLQTITN